MVYISFRHTVTDYATWRLFFDADESRRRAAGATGVKEIYRDVDDPNTITALVEFDSAESAHKFAAEPALRETMAKAGVVGMPSLVAFISRA